MKLSNRSFPYPILSPDWRDDYQDSEYQASFEQDVNNNENEVTYHFTHMCSSPDLTDLISEQKACYGVLVECTQTRLSKFFRSFEEKHSLNIPMKSLFGKFEITPQIVVLEDVHNFSPEDLHEEFGDAVFDLKPGDLLAHDDPITKSCEFQKLSFINMVKASFDERLKDYEYEIVVDDYSIKLRMGKDMLRLFTEVKQSREELPYLVMSLYKDIYLHVLSELIYDDDAQNKFWGRAMSKELEDRSISIDSDTELKELNLIAQNFASSKGVKSLIKNRDAR